MKSQLQTRIGNSYSRTNVLSAKESGTMNNGERADDMRERGIGRYKRNCIGDLCDFCFQNVYILKAQINLRTRGYKFACKRCVWVDKKVKYEKGKVLPAYDYFPKKVY